MKRMTDEEYVAADGVKCPFCGSEEIEGGPVEIDCGANQEVTCLKCERRWFDSYELTGFFTTDEED